MKDTNPISFVVVLLFLLCLNVTAGEMNLIKRLKADYGSAKTENERRAVCLEAIDKKVIARGVPLLNVEEIFGQDFSPEIGKDADGFSYGIVHFSKPIKGRPDTSDFFVGWYMVVYYDESRSIFKYHLSNLHK